MDTEKKILITGGSGFIGTNLIDYFVSKGHKVINIDKAIPRDPKHKRFWRQLDICNNQELREYVSGFSPDHIIHMAARTDLDGVTIDDYQANTLGIESLIEVASDLQSLKRIVFASSMLVCPLGYQPKHDLEFCPTTVYGKSKVIGEQIVRSQATGKLNWTIVRPTSLWGPWFGVPYRNFFDAIAHKRYIHPRGKRIRRSYGFVLNAVEAIEKIIFCKEESKVNEKVFYLADYAPIELFSWASMISRAFGVPTPKEVPLPLLIGLSKIGDGMKLLGIRNPPLSTFRLNNLLTDAVYNLKPLEEITGSLSYKLDDAIAVTVDWIKSNKTSK